MNTLSEFEQAEYKRTRAPYIKKQDTYNYKKPKRSRFKLYFKDPTYKRTFYSYDNSLTKKGAIVKDEQLGFTQLIRLAKQMKIKWGKNAECKIFMSIDPQCPTDDFTTHNELCFVISKDFRVIKNKTLNFEVLKLEDYEMTKTSHVVAQLKTYERQYLK